MSNIILGLAGAIGHDPAAALYVDGELVAACEEERFVRRKHARDEAPYLAARACSASACARRERDTDQSPRRSHPNILQRRERRIFGDILRLCRGRKNRPREGIL